MEKLMKTKPELLSQCNIPKPLHGVNPRNIIGITKWDILRQEVYKSTNYHCAACGVHKTEAKLHKWLEAHEDFDIDYESKVVKLREIVPLCHYCHRFIHSGLLYKHWEKGEVSTKFVIDVLHHGLGILDKNNLRAFPFTVELADMFKLYHGVKKLPTCDFVWEGWKLLWDGKEYEQKFKTYEEWKKYYH